MTLRLPLRTPFAIVVSIALALSVLVPSPHSPRDAAIADVANPQTLDTVALPEGVTLLTGWAMDSVNNRAVAFGTTAAGKTAAVAMNLDSLAITVVPGTISDDLVAGGTPIISGTTVTVPFTRTTAGDRAISFSLSALSRYSSTTLPASAGFGSVWAVNSVGTFGYLGTRGATTTVSKFTVPAFSPALSATLPATHSNMSTLTMVGTAAWGTFATTPTIISPISVSTLLPTQTITLAASIPALTTSVVDGDTILFGTDSTPGQIVAFSTKTKSVVGALELGATEAGARIVHLDSPRGLLYVSTTDAQGMRLVTVDVATLRVVGRSPHLPGSVRSAFAYGNHLILGSTEPGIAAVRMTLADAPITPSAVTVTEGNGRITAQWVAAESAEPITGYTARASDGASEHQCSTVELTCEITGLVNGTSYEVSVVATSAAGDSAPWVTGSVIPHTVPQAPGAVTIVRADRQLTVSWQRPDTGGADITEYRVEARIDDSVVASCTTVDTSCALVGLVNGVDYRIGVVATNRAGDSVAASSTDVSIPATTPGAPRDIHTTRGNSSIVVRWSAPEDDGGDPVAGYRVSALLGNDIEMGSCHSTGDTCVISGLTNGVAYRVTVAAWNALGLSGAMAAVDTTTPATVPAAPRIESATRFDGRVSVRWSAPADNGGTPLAGYRVRAFADGVPQAECAATTTECTLGGLVNGVAYRIQVSATNEVGNSAWAEWGTAVIPATLPDPVGSIVVTRGDGMLRVEWARPLHDGGDSITGYRVVAYLNGTVAVNTCESTHLQCDMVGVTNGVPYTVGVVAINAVGDSVQARAHGTFTPATVPGQPTIFSTERSSESIRVSVTAPTESGGEPVTGITVRAEHNGERHGECRTTTTTTTTTCLMTGLTNGANYTVSAIAHNAVGDSLPFVLVGTVRPATLPDAPRAVTASRGDRAVVVHWEAPESDGGEAITHFEAQAVASGFVVARCTTESLACVLTGLDNGQPVDVRVVAHTAVGASAAAELAGTITPATTAGAPTAVSGVRGDGTITATWTPPTTTGGEPIIRYEVRATASGLPGAQCDTDGATTCVIRGLTNGASYRLVVTAFTAVGRGADSPVSSGYVPAGLPSAPRSVAVIGATATAVSLRWAIPARINGSAVVDYRVQWSTRSTGGFATLADPVRSATSSRVARPRRGVVLYFRIIAVNGVGASVASTPLKVAAG